MSKSPKVRASSLAGVALTGATYIYFLIFAQFAFLHLTQVNVGNTGAVRGVMGVMAIAGVVGSLCGASIFQPKYARMLLMGGFLGCGVAAWLALVVQSVYALFSVSLLIGASLSLLTVALTASLSLILPKHHMGLVLGVGTGLAYATSNIPAVFAGSVILQTRVAMLACLAGVFITAVQRFREEKRAPRADLGSLLFFAPHIIIFLALVWLDSAAFVILQDTPVLNRFGWGSADLQWSNAWIHFVAAVLAGICLDHGKLRTLLLLAFACLACAALTVSARSPVAQATHWLYAGGVSLYSTALIFVPMMGAGVGCGRSVAWRAGALYAVAGWCGSALGIGMGQDLHHVPVGFLCVAGLAVALYATIYRKRTATYV